ncbi:MAG: hypothetical protein OHK006_10510 [Thermodesulfovibrionales bacterium]
MSRKRRHKRFTVEIMNIRGRMMMSSMVEIHDLTAETITLLADIRLNLGTPYVLKLEDRDAAIHVHGTVEFASLYKTVQNDEGDVVPIYKAALRLADMDETTRAKLERFIGHHRTGEAERCSRLVCKVRSGEHAILDFPTAYTVKKVSLSGMLIESNHPIQLERRMPMELGLPGYSLVHLTGRVASCLPVPESGRFDVGIEFIDMSSSDKESLKSFIEMLDAHEHEPQDLWKHQRDR